MTKEQPVLTLSHVTTSFQTAHGLLPAVDDVGFSVFPREIVAVVGESGSGKTVTCLSVIGLAGASAVTMGSIVFDVRELVGLPSDELRQVRGGEIGFVFQEPMTSLNPVMTIGRQLTEGIMLHMKLDRHKAMERARELLEMVGIPDARSRLNAYPHQFSGGMRQRIIIAMALSCNPKLLIADEATTALDVTTQAQILELMKDIVKKTKTALIIVTHNLSIVARYADRVYVMYAGEIVENGGTKDIFKNPSHPYTIGLLGAVPGLNDPKDRKLIPIDGFVTNLIDRKDQCAFMNRCPYVDDGCKAGKTPCLHAVPGDEHHFAACHRMITKASEKTVDSKDLARYTNTDSSVSHKGGQNDICLSVKNLKVYFPVTGGFMRKAVDDMSFDIYKGETFGLVGESGCGKSTVARAVLRLNDITGGKIIFDGTDITNFGDVKMRPYRRNMSMIFQDPYGSLDPRQRAGDIVMEPMKNFKLDMSPKEMENRVRELFELVGLDPAYAQRVPHEFSGGQRQRLVIARALSTNPSFIVCDEAISALDVSIQAQVINLLEELQQRLGLTYLFIAHDLSVVRHISDRVAVMYLGQLVELADWKSLYDNPLHPYTKALLEAVPIPDPELEEKLDRKVIKGEIPSPMQRPAGCAFSSRCPYADEHCRTSMPLLTNRQDGHQVACWKA